MSPGPVKVLLVEDNLGDARLICEGFPEAFPTEGFEIIHVRRLSEALERLWEDSCNVVLLDLGLPDSHGLDTLHLTRAQAPTAPIVILTGFEDEALAMMALKEGAQDYLVKGHVDSKLLERSLRYAIARKRVEEGMLRQTVALAKAEELQRSRQRIVAAQESVRRDIAARLQDRVQGRLLALRDRLQELVEKTSSSSEATRLVTGVAHDLDQIVSGEVSALGHALYPSLLEQGLIIALQSLAQRWGDVLAIDLDLDETLAQQEKTNRDLVPEQVKLAVYRIADEALNNVAKHAQATGVTLRLQEPSQGWLRLTVQDNGQGFKLEDAPLGLGMAAMQDYAEITGGMFAVRSTPGSGTEVVATLPVPIARSPQSGGAAS